MFRRKTLPIFRLIRETQAPQKRPYTPPGPFGVKTTRPRYGNMSVSYIIGAAAKSNAFLKARETGYKYLP
jgi:hypothetical protein